MVLRSPTFFAGAFLLLATAYAAYFNVAIRTDPVAAEHRFQNLMASGWESRAASHGERAIAMRIKRGASPAEIAPLKASVASAQIARKKYDRGAALIRDALTTSWTQTVSARERIRLEDELARAYLLAGQVEGAAAIYASFLDLAGDAAAEDNPDPAESLAAYYADRIIAGSDEFTGALNHTAPYELKADNRETKLATANHMASLGGYYAMRSESRYAAAGLLSSAYQARKNILGGNDQDTVQLTLILGPLYADLGRLKDAEELYLDAFHAQENSKGSNSPDLSLYIRLLSGIYEKQNRFTEAQALNEHMRRLFRDAFGAQRYAANQHHDRRANINRPVSQYFQLEPDYAPTDLVSAAEYSVPTSKSPNIDEMKLRLAGDPGLDPREANLPVRLAQLISLCRADSRERISLRSGYRAYSTQRFLFQRNAARGTVTPPGMSEHQTGLAADINVNDRFMRQSDRAFQCFEENAFRYGFILSYPPDNDYLPGQDSYEPWHWRYVGIQTAQLYREAGPLNQPQEFLAALPCYQERAANGIFPTAGEADLCLENPDKIAKTANSEPVVQPIGESHETARILNDDKIIAQSR